MVQYDLYKKKIVVFDGALGTMLIKSGCDKEKNTSIYNAACPEIVEKIHREYVNAGADIITANTFSANAIKLKSTGYSVKEIIEKGMAIAKKAAGNLPVALDIGPTGKLMEPCGKLRFEEAYNIYSEMILSGVSFGADIILIETMTDIYEAKAAVLAAKENSSLPVFCTITFDKSGKTLGGTSPLTMTFILQGLGVDALGINCSYGPKEMLPLIEEILKYSKVPVIIQPNAGIPKYFQGNCTYNISSDEFAEYACIFAKKGVRILGGCCGTTPDYIRKVKKAVKDLPPINTFPQKVTAASSGNKTVIFDGKNVIIGERINPSGREDMKKALRCKEYGYIAEEALKEEKAGADVLDINIGIPDIDEKSIMPEVIKKVQRSVGIPLEIDSTSPIAVEAALRCYNGRAVVNSVNGRDEVMEAIFPLVKKYGACVIGLTLDENGIPNRAEGRLKIAEKIIKKAKMYGIEEEDILIDCLVLSTSSSKSSLSECLRAVKMIGTKFNVKTVLGISNVSYGMPKREVLNSTFFSMALLNGLNAAIINPFSERMMETLYSYRALTSKDENSKEYLSFCRRNSKSSDKNHSKEMELDDYIMYGMKEEALTKLKELIKNNNDFPLAEDCMVKTMQKCGKLYEDGSIYLPELMRCAETINYLNEFLMQNNKNKTFKGKILMATVEGDIHDTGKNMAKMFLVSSGYDVLDMGVDVPPECIVKKVNEEGIKLVGLSALMTTTVKNMERTIKLLKNNCKGCKVMAGGPVLDEEYAHKIAADYYSFDARSAVSIADEVFKKESN